jgi:hypothetical protein
VSDIRFGWDLPTVTARIKQGGSGEITLTATVTLEDGSPLPTYDGWTAAMKLFRSPQSAEPEISKTPTVVGVPAEKQLKVTIALGRADTKGKEIGDLVGDVCVTDPAGNDDYFPANVTLTIERSYSGT